MLDSFFDAHALESHLMTQLSEASWTSAGGGLREITARMLFEALAENLSKGSRRVPWRNSLERHFRPLRSLPCFPNTSKPDCNPPSGLPNH
jgi:hypothetical protein